MPEAYSIILFDGECAFCNGSVRWIIRHDPTGRFRFAARQSPAGQRFLAEHGLPPEGVESLILIEGSKVSTHSTGTLRIAGKLPFPWKIAGLFLLVPRPIRDFFYRAVARRRYRIAGKMEACAVPTPEQRGRILHDVPA
jgi:predicted DCC family thiol-disulfide oxidoreductase YuxK